MAIKVNSNTVIDNSRNLTANTLTIVGGVTTSPTTSNTGGYEVSGSSAIDNAKHGYFVNISAKELIVTSGYVSGGSPPIPAGVASIDNFPFVSPFTTATDVGDYPTGTKRHAGQSSSTDGYGSGGGYPTSQTNRILRFPFSSSFTTATDIGNLFQSRGGVSGQSDLTNDYGYTSGGEQISPAIGRDTIDKFPFTSPFTTATDAGNLSNPVGSRWDTAGQSSSTDGYVSGGDAPGATGQINKFPFSSPFTTATNVGSLFFDRAGPSGQSSSTDGYSSGGTDTGSPVPMRDEIDKFPFSSPFTTATDVGNLVNALAYTAGLQSGGSGYVCGGRTGNDPGTTANYIWTFPFSSPFVTATDLANLNVERGQSAGHQG